eukprot:Partr_v1_DN28927_c4_g1_i11_m25252 putative Oxysterol-binding protein
MSEVEGEAVPVQHRSAFTAFLRQIGTFTGDLSQLTAPAFLLSGTSLLEYSTHWCDFPHLLHAISACDDAAERTLFVARWFLSTLYGSYHERCADGSEKKPYNPVLGEQFFTRWQEDAPAATWKSAECVVEQVSHHPPISAFHIQCGPEDHRVEVTGHCGQKTKFKGMAIRVTQTGRAQLLDKRHGETFAIMLPDLVIRGLLSGNIFLELEGSINIVGSSGYVATVEFLPKPWFVGDYHHIKGSVTGPNKEPVYELSGQWTGDMMVTDCRTRIETTLWQSGSGSVNSRPPKLVKPVAEMDDLESRKVWFNVSEALAMQEYGIANKQKTEVEERQRQLRKQRQDQGHEYRPKYFEFKPDEVKHTRSKTSSSGISGVSSSSHAAATALPDNIDVGMWVYVPANSKR